MIDKSKQLVTRVDLYGSYLVTMTLVVGICELPLLVWRLETAMIVLPVGWTIVLVLGIRRMWEAKTEHRLTPELEFSKIIVGALIAGACGTWLFHVMADIKSFRPHQLTDVVALSVITNGVAGFFAYASGIIAIWLVGALSREKL
jgi:hypothetical protein